MTETPKRLLFIRLGSLGDVVLTTPAVRAARCAFPDAEIVFLTDEAFVPLYAANPHVDEVWGVSRSRLNRSAREFLRLTRRIRAGRFDVAIDLQRKAKTALLPWLAHVSRRIGGTWLDTDRVQREPTASASEEALAALRPLGVEGGDARPEVLIAKGDLERADALLAAEGIDPAGPPLLGIFPGAGWRPRAWMPERFAEIARRAVRDWGARILLVGADKDRDLVDAIRDAVEGSVTVLMNLPLGLLAAVLARCDRFLSNDTGPMHLAVAVGTPTVALFGPGDFTRFAPRHAPHIALREPVECSPCKQFTDRCRDNICMKLLTVERVWTALETIDR